MANGPRAAVWDAVRTDLEPMWDRIVGTEGLDLETAEGIVRDGVQGIGARVLEAELARGTGKTGSRRACACGTEGSLPGTGPSRRRRCWGDYGASCRVRLPQLWAWALPARCAARLAPR